ncbi:hypothetical protein D3C77_587310 [compost metagenome]
MRSPAASAMAPCLARMTPLFSTCPPSNAIVPPSAAINTPSLTTLANVGRPSPAKRKRPSLKSSLLRFSVDATKPPTLTFAVLPNNTPLGLIRNTRPLALSCPMILLPSVPTTRFNAMELASG